MCQQNKCVKYWPAENESKEFENYVVQNLRETDYRDYTLREFSLSKTDQVWIGHVYLSVSLQFRNTSGCFNDSMKGS